MSSASLPNVRGPASGCAPVHGVEVACGQQRIEAIAAEWDDLFERAAEPHQLFQNRRLMDIWMRVYADPRDEPVVVVGRQHGRAAVLLPLVRQRRFGFSILRVMGLPVAQFSDCLAEPDLDPRLTADIWAAVEGLGADFLEARRVRADSALLRLMPPSAGFEQQEAPFARLDMRVGEQGPGEAYSARYRSNFRRRLRRLEEQGAISLLSDMTAQQERRLAAQAIEMKRRWLRRHGLQSPAIQDDRFGAFFAATTEDAASGLQVSAITVGGKPAAIDLSFACKGTCFGHVMAVEPVREEQGIGAIAVHHAFAVARANGNSVFDLLAPSNQHKMSHADGVTQIASRAYPFTSAGRLACGLLARNALPAAKGLAARLPAPLVEWLGRKV